LECFLFRGEQRKVYSALRKCSLRKRASGRKEFERGNFRLPGKRCSLLYCISRPLKGGDWQFARLHLRKNSSKAGRRASYREEEGDKTLQAVGVERYDTRLQAEKGPFREKGVYARAEGETSVIGTFFIGEGGWSTREKSSN